MKAYLDLLRDVIDNGVDSDDRTGVGTRCVFGRQLRFNLKAGFPAVTTKKLAFESMKAELLWFISGSSNVNTLRAIQYGTENSLNLDKKTVWDDNYNNQGIALGYKDGELGPVYGAQWRGLGNFGNQDQLLNAISLIKNSPDSRRIIIDAWVPEDIHKMSLPPCHMMCQFRVIKGALSCQVYIRSNDLFLGAPFNIASYALFTHLIAHVCDLDVGELVYTIGDAHIYKNHFDQVNEQLQRPVYDSPKLVLNHAVTDIEKFKMDDIMMIGYECHAAIKAEMAI